MQNLHATHRNGILVKLLRERAIFTIYAGNTTFPASALILGIHPPMIFNIYALQKP